MSGCSTLFLVSPFGWTPYSLYCLGMNFIQFWSLQNSIYDWLSNDKIQPLPFDQSDKFSNCHNKFYHYSTQISFSFPWQTTNFLLVDSIFLSWKCISNTCVYNTAQFCFTHIVPSLSAFTLFHRVTRLHFKWVFTVAQ